MFNLLDTVVLTRDVPDAGLRRGDRGAIVEVNRIPFGRIAGLCKPRPTDRALALIIRWSRLVNAPR